MRYRYLTTLVITMAFVLLMLVGPGLSQEKNTTNQKSKTPPLLVTTVEVEEGAVQEMTDFVGSTYFSRVSEVATDIEGLVREINFTEGGRVNRGDLLVKLDSELIESEIVGAEAASAQNQVDLDNARRDFERISALYKTESVSETDYDSYHAKLLRLEKNGGVLEAKQNSLLIAKNKKNIHAPFTGVVIEKSAEIGEWIAKGGKVAVIADDSNIDVWVDVPINILENLKNSQPVDIKINSREFTGRYNTFIPRGDLATRTFSVKFSLENCAGLAAGIEAVVSLPKDSESIGLLIPRDAVVDKYGKTMIFLAVDNRARMVPVEVAGYVGLQAVVTGSGLEKGQQVIVKGSKRVEDDMELQFR